MLVLGASEASLCCSPTGGDAGTTRQARSLARRKLRKPVRPAADQVSMGTGPHTPATGARTVQAPVVAEGPYGLSTLVQCLHRYVEANPSRFQLREETLGTRRLATF